MFVLDELMKESEDRYEDYKESRITFRFKDPIHEDKKPPREKLETFFNDVNICAKLVQQKLSSKLNVVFDVDHTLVFAQDRKSFPVQPSLYPDVHVIRLSK